MKSKAPLAMMEQIVMVLVFALSAALCVQVFVLSDRTSRENEARDGAAVMAQNTAEQIKSVRGDFARAAELYGGGWNGQMWGASLGADWTPAAADAAVYHVLAAPSETGRPLLGGATVAVYTADGDCLCTLTAAWQEVAEDE